MPSPACPDRDRLLQLLLGLAPEGEAGGVEAHVLTCGACVETLRAARTDDALLVAMRAQGEPEPDDDADLIDQLIGRFLATVSVASFSEKCTVAIGATARAAGAAPEALDFLAPPGGPGEIGRLGPYRVLRVVGGGGMGVVFEGEDPHLGRPVALKVPRPGLAAGTAARRRFRTEARAAAALAHENVIPIYHVGEEHGTPFLVMPLLRGETLEERLRRAGRLPPDEVMRVGREIAAGLAAAHAAGLIHRDVKPSNVWLEADSGRAVVLDFGLARLVDEAGGTVSGAVVGTPAYMAPEQARGEPPDARCDLFSLGCVLFRAATGVLPFRGPTVMATLRALELETPPAPRSLAPEIPSALSDQILALLEKRPADRCDSAAGVRDALDAIRAGQWPRGRRRDKQRVKKLALAAVLAATMGGAAFGLRGDRPGAVPAAGPTLPPAVGPPAAFRPHVSYPVGKRPYTVVIGDVNGDHKPDLVVSNTVDGTVSVLLNTGDGTFHPAVTHPAGTETHGIVIGDFDRDGKPDLAAANFGADTVIILRGNGDGTFRPGATLATGAGPRGLVAADLDGDGALDLVTTDARGNTVSIFLGAGDGTFGPARRIPVGGAPVSVAAADLNGDGRPDLVVSNGGSNTLTVLLGAGGGTFRAGTDQGVGSGPGAVVVADFDRDGNPDLAVENLGTNDVSVLLGHGDGTFRPAVAYGAGAGPGGLVAADLNGDGLTDLVVANHHGNDVTVLSGRGDGTFRPAAHHPTRWMPAGVAVADLDGDGRPDVAVVNHLSHDVSVLTGRPPGPRFRLSTDLALSAGELTRVAVTATDGAGTTESGFTCPVRVTCTDPGAEYPTRLTPDASRTATVLFIRFRTAGCHTLTVTDGADPSRVGTATILVRPGDTTRFRLAAPDRATAGQPVTVVVTATDELGNPTPEYTGVVRFTCTDGRAALPPEYRFVGTDEGTRTFKIQPATTGAHTLTVADARQTAVAGRATLTVLLAGPP